MYTGIIQAVSPIVSLEDQPELSKDISYVSTGFA